MRWADHINGLSLVTNHPLTRGRICDSPRRKGDPIMLSALTTFVAVFFVGMGLVGLIAPERITAIFGTPALPLPHRNEVRAVYGGFGVAIGVLLFATPSMPAMASGIYL